MWIIQMYGNQRFYLTNRQKELYINAVRRGSKIIEFGEVILSNNFDFICEETELKKVKLKQNQILNDPDYQEFKHTHSHILANVLDKRYPLPKYQQAWDEANENFDKLNEVKSETKIAS